MRGGLFFLNCVVGMFVAAGTVPSSAPAAPVASPSTHPAQMVENPMYKAWSAFKAGSTVVFKHTVHLESDQLKMDRQFEITSKLMSVTPQKVTIENSMTMDGQTNVHQQEISATLNAQSPQTPRSVGQETVSVNGQSYSCRIYELQMDQNGAAASARVWLTSGIPGGMVKMESDVTQGGMKMHDKGTLSKYEAK